MAKKCNDFRITTLQPTGEVTGSCILVEVDGLKILLDMGMFQSQTCSIEDRYKINKDICNRIKDIDYIVLTSSHADHCCGLGIIGNDKLGFKGNVITTELVANLAKLNISDSAYIMDVETRKYNDLAKNKAHNKHLNPVYTIDEAEKAIGMIRGYGYDDVVYLNNNVYIEFLPNGHVSGDCSIFITYQKAEYDKKRLLYTGDVYFGKNTRPFTTKWIEKCYKTDCVITESTYGGVDDETHTDPIDVLEQYILDECIGNNRTLFIPCFAIHRSTHILWMLKQIYDRNEKIRERNIPIYACGNMLYNAHNILGSPMANDFYDEEWRNNDVFGWNKVTFLQQFPDVEDRIAQKEIKIVIATGGMIQAHSKYICTQYLPLKRVAVLFCGYQADGTIGRAILDTIESGKKSVEIDGERYTIRAKLLGVLYGLSGHARHNGLVQLVQSLNQRVLKKVIIVHGTQKHRQLLKDDLTRHLNGRIEIIIAKQNDVIKF